MASRTVVQLTDDIEGTTVEGGDGGTASFSFDGRSYESDLNAKNLKKFQDTMSF